MKTYEDGKIYVFPNNQPCLQISTSNTVVGPNVGKRYGLNRDRIPDSGWSENRNTIMTKAKQVELTPELKQILIEDLAYTYGHNTKVFADKLKEFNLIPN